MDSQPAIHVPMPDRPRKRRRVRPADPDEIEIAERFARSPLDPWNRLRFMAQVQRRARNDPQARRLAWPFGLFLAALFGLAVVLAVLDLGELLTALVLVIFGVVGLTLVVRAMAAGSRRR
jgi:Flp pilus assembly protein TadB